MTSAVSCAGLGTGPEVRHFNWDVLTNTGGDGVFAGTQFADIPVLAAPNLSLLGGLERTSG